MSLCLAVEPIIGDGLRTLLLEAWELGRRLDIVVTFKFNDGAACCYPDGRAHLGLPEGLNQYRLAARDRTGLPIVEERRYRGGEGGAWTEWERMER